MLDLDALRDVDARTLIAETKEWLNVVTFSDVARHFNIDPGTIQRYHRENRMPAPVRWLWLEILRLSNK